MKTKKKQTKKPVRKISKKGASQRKSKRFKFSLAEKKELKGFAKVIEIMTVKFPVPIKDSFVPAVGEVVRLAYGQIARLSRTKMDDPNFRDEVVAKDGQHFTRSQIVKRVKQYLKQNPPLL